jgi:hypothetical protein
LPVGPLKIRNFFLKPANRLNWLTGQILWGGRENVIRTQTKSKGPSAQSGKTAELSLTLPDRKNAWLKSNSRSPKKVFGTIRKRPNPS